MPSSILNSDDGVISGTSGLKSSGGDDGTLAVQSNGTELAKFKTTELVINDGGANYDFRVEGDTNANLLVVDASADRVGIGTNAPGALLEIFNDSANLGVTASALLKGSSGPNISFELTGTGANVWNVGMKNNDDDLYVADGTTDVARFDGSANFYFNSGYGSVATAYGCRAWVNFNGTGTVAIREDGNVSSITDRGTGRYTINFSTAMPDSNYLAMAQSGNNTSFTSNVNRINPYSRSTTSFLIDNYDGGVADPDTVLTDRDVIYAFVIR